MMPMEERFKEAIEKAKFNFFELIGFKSNPDFALLAGAAIGYKLAIEDVQKLRGSKSRCSRTGTRLAELNIEDGIDDDFNNAVHQAITDKTRVRRRINHVEQDRDR